MDTDQSERVLLRRSVPSLYLTLGIVQAVHSVEEIVTRLYARFPVVTGSIHQAVGFFPVMRMSEQTFAVLNILIITFILAVCPFVFQGITWAYRIARIIAIVEMLNGMGHISAAFYVGHYYPGCISGVGLVGFSLLLYKNLMHMTDHSK